MSDLYGLMMLVAAGYQKGGAAQNIDLYVSRLISGPATTWEHIIPTTDQGIGRYIWGANNDMTLFRDSGTGFFTGKIELKHPNGNTAWDFENTDSSNFILNNIAVIFGPSSVITTTLNGDRLFPEAAPTGGNVTLEPQQIARFTSLKVGLRG